MSGCHSLVSNWSYLTNHRRTLNFLSGVWDLCFYETAFPIQHRNTETDVCTACVYQAFWSSWCEKYKDIPWSSRYVKFLPFGSFCWWKGTNFTHLEDPGIYIYYIYVYMFFEIVCYFFPRINWIGYGRRINSLKVQCLGVSQKQSKKSPTGPTERTPKPEYLIAL